MTGDNAVAMHETEMTKADCNDGDEEKALELRRRTSQPQVSTLALVAFTGGVALRLEGQQSQTCQDHPC